MTITALPEAPSRSDTPANFIAKADAFVAAMAVLVTEMNAAIGITNLTKWISGTTYAIGDVTWSPADFQAYRRKTAGAGTTDPSADSTNWQRTEYSATSAQTQSATAFTTAGTAPAFTLTPTPAPAAYAAGQRFRVKFNAAGTTGSNTLNFSGLGAKNIKQYDAYGTKVAGVVTANLLADVEYDGTDMVILDPLPPSTGRPSRRQTVLSGPVDASGLPAFGGATGSTTVTATGTLKVTAAAGGDDDYTGSIVNPSWTGLSTNGTMHLYCDVTAAGVVSTGSCTLAPVEQFGGSYSNTSGQHTYNVQEGTMKVGTGAAATQVYRNFVGEVTVAGNVVTAITWYGLKRRYRSPATALPAISTAATFNHNLGTTLVSRKTLIGICKTAELGYAIGDKTTIVMASASGRSAGDTLTITGRNTATINGGSAGWYVSKKSATIGDESQVTVANWDVEVILDAEV